MPPDVLLDFQEFKPVLRALVLECPTPSALYPTPKESNPPVQLERFIADFIKDQNELSYSVDATILDKPFPCALVIFSPPPHCP